MLDRLKREGLAGGPPLVMGLAVLANYSSSAGRVMISPLVPAITDAFTVSNSVIGLALTGMWVAFALTQFPSGVLSDRYGERRLILLALAFISLGGLVVAAAPTFRVFVLGVVPLGGGSGLYLVAATSYLTKQFEETGVVLGLHSTGASLGGLTIPVVVVAVAARADWRAGLFVGAGVAALAFALFARYSTESAKARPENYGLARLTAVDFLIDQLEPENTGYITTGITTRTGSLTRGDADGSWVPRRRQRRAGRARYRFLARGGCLHHASSRSDA